MVSFGSIFVLAVVVFLVNLIILWCLRKVKTQTYYLSRYVKYPVLFLLLFININIYFDIDFSTIQNSHLNYSETPMYPIRNDKTNIVFIIGESMKYDDYVEKKLQKQKHFYKKIYAGATNTDVSVPLLLNVKNNPLKLSKKKPKQPF
jgi:glucan phosphoethanolaminetransferase (alkaline phosphatase superfamily)